MRVPASLLLTLLLACPTGLRSQNAPAVTGSISAAQILQKYIDATGGLDANKRLQSLIAQGDFGFYLPHPLGSYTFSYKAPSRDVMELDMISHGISWSGRRDNHLIKRATVEGVDMINGAGIEIVEQDWRSLLEWDFTREYSKIELIGRAQVDKRWAFALRFTPRQGDPVVRFYDQETGLLVRMDQVQHFQFSKKSQTVYAVETYFRDYADRDGLKLPQTIAISRPGAELLFNVTRVRSNVQIDDAIFR